MSTRLARSADLVLARAAELTTFTTLTTLTTLHDSRRKTRRSPTLLANPPHPPFSTLSLRQPPAFASISFTFFVSCRI